MSGPDPQASALHVIRCTAMATAERLASRLGASADELHAWLDPLTADGLLVHRETPAMAFWAITTAGKAADDAAIRAELESAGSREQVADAYERFLVLNPQMLQLCNDWQMRDVAGEQVPNDHTDPAYDGAVKDRLKALDGDLQAILDELEGALGRFARYRPAFEAALERLAAGDPQFFTGVRVDSYHTVWFELHEDLLSTVGISREEEAARV